MDNTQGNINYQQGLKDSRKSKQINNHGQKLSKAIPQKKKNLNLDTLRATSFRLSHNQSFSYY